MEVAFAFKNDFDGNSKVKIMKAFYNVVAYVFRWSSSFVAMLMWGRKMQFSITVGSIFQLNRWEYPYDIAMRFIHDFIR